MITNWFNETCLDSLLLELKLIGVILKTAPQELMFNVGIQILHLDHHVFSPVVQTMTPALQEIIVDRHNYYRNQVAGGNVRVIKMLDFLQLFEWLQWYES
ncbi:hypothetical protein PVAND_009392 [Polypedilum vanderplanki]|uniref:Uncharacterized protein n=1 Tax=Polypedilum vanderplanki TaxID=319348 RepID=A0A9J6CD04_POLVA|nr:hypothetical protein PVAND_009392 [Polypedilum vanderplanki]